MNKKLKNIIILLDELFPSPRCALNFENNLQLLVATILSAQCTDKQVNKVTPKLFKKYKLIEDYVETPIEILQEDIKSIGFYKSKAKYIKESCKKILNLYNGEVPSTLEELVTLSGVGRKTASVVLYEAFGKPGIFVDTHVKRLTNRIGLTKHAEPEKIEKDIAKLLPKKMWGKFCHQLIWHGRYTCKARKPLCLQCKLQNFCDYYKQNI